jgi:aerobic-type carbon monoxide dehydrogenase small subunit (CoxS/CutS family)
MSGTIAIRLTVNGISRQADVAPQRTLLDLLRDDLGLTGTKECCLVGECGACTVSLDGKIVDSCLVLAAETDGAEVTTIEGLAADGGLSRLQQAFLDSGAVQCGYCSPGQVMAASDLLARIAHPTVTQIQEGMAGNLCRCGCYRQITEAVLAASAETQR